MKDVMLKHKTISKKDLDYIDITDDPKEVVTIINKHMEWKRKMIKEAGKIKLHQISDAKGDTFL